MGDPARPVVLAHTHVAAPESDEARYYQDGGDRAQDHQGTRAYFEFMMSKMPAVIEDWHASKDALVDELANRHTSST